MTQFYVAVWVHNSAASVHSLQLEILHAYKGGITRDVLKK